MDVLQRVRCVFGRHKPNLRRARHDGDVLRSRCTGCGAEMIQHYSGWMTRGQELARIRRKQREG